MFVLVVAVPALLVVVLGYAVGHGLATWIGGRVDGAAGTWLSANAEVVGWIIGLLLLAVGTRVAVRVWRARRDPR